MSFKGEVEWFDNKKGYGLIIPDNNNDYTRLIKKFLIVLQKPIKYLFIIVK